MLAPHHTYHNFARIHQSRHLTPAIDAGITDHVWSVEDIVALLNLNARWASSRAEAQKSGILAF
jgi:hypothetical protein